MASDSRRAPESRLIGVVIGIDAYEKHCDLRFAVNDARSMRRTLEEAHQGKLELQVLSAGEVLREGESYASRSVLLGALKTAARQARPADTILVFYAGHGCLIEGMIHLMPADSDPQQASSLVSIRELQQAFDGCESSQRLLFLDCCQTPGSFEAAAEEDLSDRAAPEAPVEWRSGMPLFRGYVEALEEQLAGWTALTSCSPGEESRETRDEASGLEEYHGLFTHFLARGLQGDADLDDDGVVSFAELVQYVCQAVPRRVNSVYGPTVSQNPSVIWRGAGWLPLTLVRPDWRGRPEPGFLRLWRQRAWERWPYREIPIGDWMRLGTSVLYGLIIFLEVLILGADPAASRWQLTAVLCGLASGFVWLAVSGLSMAANEHRWHSGGYLSVGCLVAWHLLLLVAVVELPGAGDSRAMFDYGVHLVAIMGLMVILGLNAFHFILSLVSLLKEGDDSTLRHLMKQLREKPLDARHPNVIPTASVHPRIYIWCFGLFANLFILLHSLEVLIEASERMPTPEDVLGLARNAILIALILWQVFSYSSAYKHVEHNYTRQI